MVSVKTTQPCHYSGKAAVDTMQMDGCGCVHRCTKHKTGQNWLFADLDYLQTPKLSPSRNSSIFVSILLEFLSDFFPPLAKVQISLILKLKEAGERDWRLKKMKKMGCLIQGIMAKEMEYIVRGLHLPNKIFLSFSGMQGDLGQTQVLSNTMQLSYSLWTK